MQAYRIETTIQQNGTLTLDNLPLQAGEAVEIIILVRPSEASSARYALHGTAVTYADPAEPVAQTDWEVTA